jgi:hypothetical protein
MPEDYKHNASIDATILMLLRLWNASQPAHSCNHKFLNEIHEFSEDHMYEGWERSKIWLAFHDYIGNLERLVG